ncbi:hypothetical protein Patl1_10378 [Pistacia atlantica]|uniref:Uncharacterized protein n=1 Tax=Pistacia atlantica TaxID=434234 RepID=A0ACC1A4H3_9ROSI|nr:hypothetical protein Patl1_10378 [Pistacia atlantica]
MELTSLPSVLNWFLCFGAMVSWESLMVPNCVLLNFPVMNKGLKVFLTLLMWFGSITTKRYLAGLFLPCLRRWFPLFMALRLLSLLGNPLAHVLRFPQPFVFLLSRESYNLYSKALCLAKVS